MRDVSFELWVDDPPKLVCTPAYFDELVDSGISGIAIMLDETSRAWDPRWSTKQLATVSKLAEARNLYLGLTTWSFPDPAVIAAIERSMLEWTRAFPFHEWESDLEFNWQPRMVAGFKAERDGKGRVVRTALDLAGDRLVEAKRRVRAALHHCTCFIAVPGPKPGLCASCGKTYFNMAATTLPGHAEGGSRADVTDRLDLLWLQCYSTAVRRRRSKESDGKWESWNVPWTHSYGPGRMQTMSLDRALLIPGIEDGKPRVGVGLAGWSQDWPGHTPDEALSAAVTAARIHPVFHYARPQHVVYRIWSSKFFLGVKRNHYTKRFVRALMQRPFEAASDPADLPFRQ